MSPGIYDWSRDQDICSLQNIFISLTHINSPMRLQEMGDEREYVCVCLPVCSAPVIARTGCTLFTWPIVDRKCFVRSACFSNNPHHFLFANFIFGMQILNRRRNASHNSNHYLFESHLVNTCSIQS